MGRDLLHIDKDEVDLLNLLCISAESEAQETDITESQTPMEEACVPGPPTKSDHSARPKIPSYPQTRRPAGGMSRPLPSPGENALSLRIFQNP